MAYDSEKKETRDNTNGWSQGDGISMVLGEGKKPGGEEVSVGLVYAPRITDRPTLSKWHWEYDALSERHWEYGAGLMWPSG